MNDTKLRLDYFLNLGLEIVKGDGYINKINNYSGKCRNSIWIKELNYEGHPQISDLFITSFTWRKNEGTHPTNRSSDIPVVYRRVEGGSECKGMADKCAWDIWKHSSDILSWKPDLELLIKMQIEYDEKQVLTKDCHKVVNRVDEYIKIENPCVFSLKDDFESGNLYSLDSNKQATCITELLHLTASALNNNIYRKQYWTNKLDGTKKNAVWCEVWDNSRDRSRPVIDHIISVNWLEKYKYIGCRDWINAEPIPQEMVDFINREVTQ